MSSISFHVGSSGMRLAQLGYQHALLVVGWAIAFLLLGETALPGGCAFALLVLYWTAAVLGEATRKLSDKIPPLLGMSRRAQLLSST